MAANLLQPFDRSLPASHPDAGDQEYNESQQYYGPPDPDFEDTNLDQHFIMQDEEPSVVLGRIEAECLKLLRGLDENPPRIPDMSVVSPANTLRRSVTYFTGSLTVLSE